MSDGDGNGLPRHLKGDDVSLPVRLVSLAQDVLGLIAAGHTAKEVARMLAIAPKTADNHIQNLYSKIGVSSRAGAALYALERGMIAQEKSAA